MSLNRRIGFIMGCISLLLVLLLVAACGGGGTAQSQKPTPTPSPTVGPGQQLLDKVGQNLSTAKTLHGVFDLTITGQTFSGVVNLEIWNALPGKSNGRANLNRAAQKTKRRKGNK